MRSSKYPSTARLIARGAWRWSWLFSLPLSFLFLQWAVEVGKRYEDFGLRYSSFGGEQPLLHRIGSSEFQYRLRNFRLATTSWTKQGSLDQVHLYISENARESLESNLPHSGRNYVDAWVLYPTGKAHKVRVKYRGDFRWHWAYYKKSIRIRTKRSRLFDGMRTFNLIAPKFDAQLNNFLSYRLAERLSLITPKHRLVSLWINGENRGVHLLAEQLDESTLRRVSRMPGDVYRGELVGRDKYGGVRNDLFSRAAFWDKIAVNNHYPEESFAPIEALVSSINRRSKLESEDWRFLLDPTVWGRFLAFETLTQTRHYGNTHNWRLYFDPIRSRFEPLIWDPDGWHPMWMPKEGEKAELNIQPSRLHKALLSDHRFLHARHDVLSRFFRSGQDLDFLEEVDTTIDAIRTDIELDPNHMSAFRLHQPDYVLASANSLRDEMALLFSEIRGRYLEGTTELEYVPIGGPNSGVEFRVKGREPVAEFRVAYTDTLESPPAEAKLEVLTEAGVQIANVTPVVSLQGRSLVVSLPLLADLATEDAAQEKSPIGDYRLELEGIEPGNQILAFTGSLESGREIVGKRVDGGWDFRTFRSAHVVPQMVAEEPIVWRGTQHLKGTTRLSRDLVIEPGTDVRFDSAASLIIEGRLIAQGTEERPIRFLSADSDQDPWGSVVLQGEGANDSLLEYCRFSNGSGLKSELFEYSAMLSIHDVQDVTISNCHFRDNKFVDDMLRAAYSKVWLLDSRFENALFDAVDFDVVEGLVRDCQFIGSGNDALDLMSSQVVVLDSRMEGSSDKGISVGEGATLVAIDTLLIDNAIGVESKDTSEALIFNSTFENNRLSLNAYAKNWRYGDGGSIGVWFSRLNSDTEIATSDKRSEIVVAASDIDGPWTNGKTLHRVETNSLGTRIPEFAKLYETRIKSSQRGRVHGD